MKCVPLSIPSAIHNGEVKIGFCHHVALLSTDVMMKSNCYIVKLVLIV